MRTFSLEDIKKAFMAGFNRGVYVASLIKGAPVDTEATLPEYLEKEYGILQDQETIKEKDEINVV